MMKKKGKGLQGAYCPDGNGNPIKKLLRASLDLFAARHTGILYGTDETRIKSLPTSRWDRGIMDGLDGRGFRGLALKLFGARIVTSKKLSPVYFYETAENGQRRKTSGIIAHVLRNCADYYKKGINIIICPDTRSLPQPTADIYFDIPFFVYNGRQIKKSVDTIRADVRIVRHFQSINSIYIYLPDYGILVINTADPSLLELRADRFVQEKVLLDRLDTLSKMVDSASLDNLGLLRGKAGARLLWRKEKHLRSISRELIENEKKYRNLYQTAPIAYISMDPDGAIINANQRAEELSGYSREALIGRNVSTFLLEPTQKAKVIATIREALLNGRSIEPMELRMKPKEGEAIWIRISVDAVKDFQGRPVEFRAMIMDISQRKVMEDQLLQARKMEVVGRLSGGIAHDFNNILSPIFGYTQMLLKETDETDPCRAHLNTILDCVSRARELVSQMLTFSRQKEPVLTPLNLSAVVDEAMTLIRSSLPSTIRLEVGIEAGDAVILADSIQIHQVMMSLVMTAYLAIGDTGGTVGIRLVSAAGSDLFPDRPGPDENGYVCLSIEDDGDAMAPDMRDKVFDPYFHLNRGDREPGIGLSVVRGIVEGHHGRIRFTDRDGGGNRFEICFPVCGGYAGPDLPERCREECRDYSEIRRGGETILLVDDDQTVADMQTDMFEKLGYTVHCHVDPLAALDRLKESPSAFDLVITDLIMPGLEGIELANHIRLIRPDLPVIICSGLEETVRRGTLNAPSVKGVLKKPISLWDVSNLLTRVFDSSGCPGPSG